MRWEYLTAKVSVAGTWGISFDVDKTDEFINEFGQEGWELVSAVGVNDGSGFTKEIAFIFKRPAAQ